MIRITGGERRGTILTAPAGYGTRPATARTREWIFDVIGPPEGLRVLDLYAGTGAVGLEALSRGALNVLFVESWKPALECLQSNLKKTRYTDRSEIWPLNVEQAAARLKREDRVFELCFCDPPYEYENLEELLAESVLELIAPGGTLVVEHRGDPALAPRAILADRVKSFGDTVVSLWIDPEKLEEV